MRRLILPLSIAVLMVAAGQGQAPAPQVQILSPEPNSYLSGPTKLKAGIDPESAAASVTFLVDNHPVCEIPQPPFECEWDAGADVSEHQIRLIVTLPDAHRVVKTLRSKSLEFDDKVDVDAVQVTVTVSDDSGRFVAGIPRSAFHISEDGKPQTISHFTSENVPLELITAIDISGSMTPSMSKLKKAVKEFLTAIPERHQVTLLGFNDTVFPLARKTTDPLERVRAVDRLAPWGATALYDVILLSSTLGS